MALVINDRVKETSTTTGTGALALASSSNWFCNFCTRYWNYQYDLLCYL